VTLRNARILVPSLAGALVLAASLGLSQPHAPAARPAARPAAAAATPPAAAAATPPAAALTGVQRFEMRPSGISRIGFTSDAPLETIDGVSTATTGNFTVDVGNPSRNLTGTVQVAVSTLRTGSDMRDEHLRSANWLDAEHNPNIALELRGTTINTALTANTPATGRLRARLTMHGVTRDVDVPVTVRLIPLAAEHQGMQAFGINADMLRVQSEFHVNLTDYGVSIMAPLRLKVSNDILIRVNATAFRQAP
jgi:polyisoprenoid-binding protein YceI